MIDSAPLALQWMKWVPERARDELGVQHRLSFNTPDFPPRAPSLSLPSFFPTLGKWVDFVLSHEKIMVPSITKQLRLFSHFPTFS